MVNFLSGTERISDGAQYAELTVTRYMVWVAAVIFLAGLIVVTLFILSSGSMGTYILVSIFKLIKVPLFKVPPRKLKLGFRLAEL